MNIDYDDDVFVSMDYNPSLCKDYNETGFCGYGGIAYWMILYEYGNDDDVVMM